MAMEITNNYSSYAAQSNAAGSTKKKETEAHQKQQGAASQEAHRIM